MVFVTARHAFKLTDDQAGPDICGQQLSQFVFAPPMLGVALPCRYSVSKACSRTPRVVGRPLGAVAAEVLSCSSIFRLSRHSSAAQDTAWSGQHSSPLSAAAAAAASVAPPAPAAAALQQRRPVSSSSSSSSANDGAAGSSVRPPWLGADLDVAGFTKRGWMRGGGKSQNQDRGLIIERFRSDSELLVGVMDGHGSAGHFVSSFLVQHLPAMLMQKLVAAAATLLPGMTSGSTDTQQQPLQKQQKGRRAGASADAAIDGSWNTQLACVLVPHHHPVFSSSSSDHQQQQQQQQHGKRVLRHKVLQVHPSDAELLADDPTLDPQHLSTSSSNSSSSGSSAGGSSDGQVAVPAALVNRVPLTPLLLSAVFRDTDAALAGSGINVIDSGSTALLCHIGHDSITTAWVGDSRAILGRKRSGSGGSQQQQWQVVQLSDDHKPERPDEQLRICANNGRVQQLAHPATGQGIGPWRVWFRDLEYPGLAMSRAFGDLPARRIGVTAEPELHVHRLQPADQLLVVASDGVWEYMSNEEVLQVAAGPDGTCDSAETAARRLVEAAEARWRSVDGGGYVDDITAVIVRARGGSRGR